jgi:hypothetical protein
MKQFRAYEHFGVTKLAGKTLVFKLGQKNYYELVPLRVTYFELISYQKAYEGYEFIGVE